MKKRIAAGLTGSAMIFSMLSALPVYSAQEESSYTEGSLTALVFSEENEQQVDCRYYDDMPGIAYIRLGDFCETLVGEQLDVSAGESVFTFTWPDGTSASVDTDSDVMTSDNLGWFVDYCGDDDDTVFSYEESLRFEPEAQPGSLDFGKYDIDLHADEDDVWIPVITACDTFQPDTGNAGYENGKLYFFDPAEGFDTMSVFKTSYFSDMMQNGRPDDLVEFSYNELCFVVDNFYGFPGRIPLNDVLAQKGLDGMLDTNDDTKMVKQLLKSTDLADYIVGLEGLSRYFYDGGHTTFNPTSMFLMYDELFEKLNETGISDIPLEGAVDSSDIENQRTELEQTLKALRAEVFGIKTADSGSDDASLPDDFSFPDDLDLSDLDTEDISEDYQDEEKPAYYYFKSGDTAVFSFDSFDCDYSGWIDYYNGGERPDDLVSGIYDSLVDADSDPEIRNFVFDLSTNGGGLDTIVFFIMSEIANQSEFTQEWLLSKTTAHLNIITDRNLDGVYDEKDKEVSFDLNFGVICSQLSFSCGNFLPSLMKDQGMLVLGETSGGGSCVVKMRTTAEGLPYAMSSSLRLINAGGENIDPGVEPDFPLVITSTNGELDYSQMFDMAKISAAFAEFYGLPADDSSAAEESSKTDEASKAEESSQPVINSQSDKAPATGASIPAAAAAVIMLAVLTVSRKRS